MAIPSEIQANTLSTTSTSSFYKEIDLLPSADDPRRLLFVAAPGASKPPDEMLVLRQDYERTARLVSVLFEDEVVTRREIFLLLHRGADRGLRGPEFNIEDGRANLSEVRETIVDFAHKVRDRRLREYNYLLFFCGVLPLIIGLVVLFTAGFGWLKRPDPNQIYDAAFTWSLAVFWITSGRDHLRLGGICPSDASWLVLRAFA